MGLQGWLKCRASWFHTAEIALSDQLYSCLLFRFFEGVFGLDILEVSEVIVPLIEFLIFRLQGLRVQEFRL